MEILCVTHEMVIVMKTRSVVLVVTAIIFIAFGVSTFSSIVSLSTIIESSSEKEAALFLGEVERDITESFSDSVSISKTINNTFIREFIANRDAYSDAEASDYVGKYLDGIKSQFGYDTAFLVIDCTTEYFTEYGRMKVLDLKGEDDRWYSDFKSKDAEMELNVDNDQANDNRITVYNNIRMYDENNQFIGVCGVGHTLENLNSAIDQLESRYGLSIVLADKSGVIRLAGDDSLSGTQVSTLFQAYIDHYDFSAEYKSDLVGTGGYVIVKYIPEYDWFLCVERPEKKDEMQNIVLKNLLAALASLVLMVLFISVAMKYQENETKLFKADSETDSMTGLYNRRAFTETMDEIRKNDSVREVSIAIVDVNGLKQVNDEKGHMAGDELIKNTAASLFELYGDHGKAYRIGGDEFAVIIMEPLDDVEECVKQIRTRISKCKLQFSEALSVAIGVARGEDYLNLSVDELFEKADKAMYSDKEEYYKDKRHERRSRNS